MKERGHMLTQKQTAAIVESANTPSATFFTYEQLQRMIEKFGPNAKIITIQEILAKQQGSKH